MFAKEIPSPIGLITLASNGENLTGLWLAGQKYFAAGAGQLVAQPDLPIFTRTEDWLCRYFSGQAPDPRELPLAPIGSPFRQAVWSRLLEIPYGDFITYGEIARSIGCRSAQAVGGAVGHNPISIVIPCHRVVGANGQLTGYAGGLEKKDFLLKLEQAHPCRPISI